MPARAPGVPAMGAMTTTLPSRISTCTPMPPNSLLISSERDL